MTDQTTICVYIRMFGSAALLFEAVSETYVSFVKGFVLANSSFQAAPLQNGSQRECGRLPPMTNAHLERLQNPTAAMCCVRALGSVFALEGFRHT